MKYVILLCFIVFHVAVGEESVDRARRSTGLIVNGENAGRGTFPEFAWIFVNDAFYCGGTILDNRTILTAAHCATERRRSYSVAVGKYKYSEDEGNEQYFDVSQIIAHEDYQFGSDDIALFKLDDDIIFNARVKPATIAKTTRMESNKTLCYAVGAGAYEQTEETSENPRVLQKLETNIIGRKRCRKIVGRELDLPARIISKSVLCTFDDNAGVCFGDSGGPLGCYDAQDNYVQYGLLSYGSTTCVDGFNVFTRVSKYRSWINRNI